MKTYMLVLAVALFGAIVMIEGGKGGKGKKGGGGWMKMMKNMTCQGEPLNEAMWQGMKECGEEMKAAKAEKKEGDDGEGKGKGGKCWGKMGCFQVCVLKKQGVLNSNGDYDSAGANDYILKAFPAKATDAVKSAMDGCAAKIGDAGTRMDNNCAGYKDFNDCMKMDIFGKACGNEEKMKKWQEMKKNWKGKKGGETTSTEDDTADM